jgi:hypothetical protein
MSASQGRMICGVGVSVAEFELNIIHKNSFKPVPLTLECSEQDSSTSPRALVSNNVKV